LNYKKILIGGISGIVLVFALYLGVHYYANSKMLDTYTEGFKKNPLGDYAKNESGMVLATYDTPLFQSYTNLSISTKDKVDLIVWVPIYGGELSYGLIVTDDENEKNHQIMVNENLEPLDLRDKDIIDGKQDAINAIKSVAKKEWALDL